jgi:hypothetical protein
MHNLSLIAAAEWLEAAARSTGEGRWFLLFLAFLSLFVAVGVLAYMLLQRFAEMMIGRWRTTTRELMLSTFLAAVLCALLQFIGRMHGG